MPWTSVNTDVDPSADYPGDDVIHESYATLTAGHGVVVHSLRTGNRAGHYDKGSWRSFTVHADDLNVPPERRRPA